jgi:hypothetical protein
MNISIARKLHERRFRASPVMTTGELLNLIGSDGIQEALEKRWLVADELTGLLTLNTGGGKLLELESACKCKDCGKTDCDCAEKDVTESRVMPTSIREAFAGYGLSRPEGASTPTGGTPMVQTDTTPKAPTSPVAQPRKPFRVGEPASVSVEGNTYNGEISNFEADGRVRLRFKGDKPPQDRSYAPGEFMVTDEK